MVRKNRINYDLIDEEIRELCRLLNKFPFLATSASCQGHVDRNMAMYLMFEVYDEVSFLLLCASVAKRFSLEAQRSLNMEKVLVLDVQHPYSFYRWEIFSKTESGFKNARKVLYKKVKLYETELNKP